MPELPELEVAVKTLKPCVAGKIIAGVLVGRERAIRTPREDGPGFAAGLEGRTIQSVERRGKALLFRLSGGAAVVFHYKLGALAACRREALQETAGVAWNFRDGSALEFTDMQLSEFHLAPEAELARLSVLKDSFDPLSRGLTAKKLAGLLPAGKQLKAALMDQEVLGGIGNNYSDEILWNARLSPFRKTAELSGEEMEELARQIKATLRESIKSGGEEEFRDALGRRGRYQEKVHRRAGQPCPRDGHEIEMVKKGRKTFWCPHCQV